MAAETTQVRTGVDALTTLHSQKKSTKESGLYNLINQLLEARHSLLQGRRIDTASAAAKHQAHYLRFERGLESVTPLYNAAGFRLCERHVTVDKYFKLESSPQGMSGFSYVHYTEKHEILSAASGDDKSQAKKYITVHAHFNTQGQFVVDKQGQLDIWVTSPSDPANGNKGKQEIENKKDAEVEYQKREATRNEKDLIQGNSLVPLDIIRSLLVEKTRQVAAAQNEIETHEQRLNTLDAAGLQTESSIRTYIEVAKECLKAIEKFNALNDWEVDRRGVIIQRRIDTLEVKLSTLQQVSVSRATSSQKPADTKDKTDANETEGSPLPRPEANLEVPVVRDLSEVLFQKIEIAEKELGELLAQNMPKSFIEAYQKAMDLRELVFQWKAEQNFDKPEQIKQKFLAKTEKLIESIETSQALEKLNQYVKEGKKEEFENLFHVVKDKIKYKYFADWLFAVIFQEDRTNLPAQEGILKFLFNNSESYRNYILLADQNAIKAYGMFCSFLYWASFDPENIGIYSLLLDQGYNPNGAATWYNGKIISLLKGLTQNKNPIYTELLLKRGAILNQVSQSLVSDLEGIRKLDLPTEIMSEIESKNHQENVTKLLMKTQLRNEGNARLFEAMLDTPSDLLMACKCENSEVVALLAPKSSFEEIVRAFSYASTYLNIQLVPMMLSSGVEFLEPNNDNAKILGIERREAEKTPEVYRVKVVLNPSLATNDPNARLGIAKVLYKHLRERCGSNPKLIDETIAIFERRLELLKLTDNGDETAKKKNQNTKIFFYMAIRFLIVEKGPLSSDDVLKLMQISCKLAQIAGNKELTQHEFEYALGLGDVDSAYSSNLKEHSIYQFAKRRLEQVMTSGKDSQTSANPILFSDGKKATPSQSEPKPAKEEVAAKPTASQSAMPEPATKKNKKKKK